MEQNEPVFILCWKGNIFLNKYRKCVNFLQLSGMMTNEVEMTESQFEVIVDAWENQRYKPLQGGWLGEYRMLVFV